MTARRQDRAVTRTGVSAMKSVKLFESGFLLCLTLALSGCIFHRPAYYSAQVLMKDGVPCFSVANSRKERASPPEISSVNVFPYEGNEIVPLWRRIFPPDQPTIRLSPHECIPYGAGENMTPPLKHNFRYGISIFSFISGDTMNYQSYFCLYETADGRTDIHHAQWNNKTHERDWGACGQ